MCAWTKVSVVESYETVDVVAFASPAHNRSVALDVVFVASLPTTSAPTRRPYARARARAHTQTVELPPRSGAKYLNVFLPQSRIGADPPQVFALTTDRRSLISA